MTSHDNVTDIVERLEYCSNHGIFDAARDNMHVSHREAADTIASLRKQLDDAREALGEIADARWVGDIEAVKAVARKALKGKSC